MKATGKDAFNLIRHWRDESSQVYVRPSSPAERPQKVADPKRATQRSSRRAGPWNRGADRHGA